LPFWSSVHNDFTLRTLPEDSNVKLPKGKEPRKGVLIEPFRPKALFAVEIAGGKVRAKIPSNPGDAKLARSGTTEEECATEVLFIAPDGRLEVHSSYRDREDPDRKDRDANFKKWVRETEEKAKAHNPGGTTPGKSDF
jgi:hypothetical protein